LISSLWKIEKLQLYKEEEEEEEEEESKKIFCDLILQTDLKLICDLCLRYI